MSSGETKAFQCFEIYFRYKEVVWQKNSKVKACVFNSVKEKVYCFGEDVMVIMMNDG